MKSIFAYIFKHKDYNNVVTTYDKVIKNYKSAYEVWMKQQSRPLLKFSCLRLSQIATLIFYLP